MGGATLCRMKRALLLAAVLAAPGTVRAQFVAPSHPESCILEAVAGRMSVVLSDAVPRPELRYASTLPDLRQYHDDIENEYGPGTSKPYEVVTNMFLPKRNVIYISDRADLYGRFGRVIDDSVAHEYAHYLQFFYQGEKDNPAIDHDKLEVDAVRVQEWFRATYIAAGRSPCAGR